MTTFPPSPRSGDDTYDLIDDALAALAERRGAWPGDDLTAITLTASLIDQAERFLPGLETCPRRWQAQAFLDRCHPAAGEAAGPGGAPAAKRGRTTWTCGKRRPQSATRKAAGNRGHTSLPKLCALTQNRT